LHATIDGDPLKKSQTLVIGVGNPYRGDDGVGNYIAGKLAAFDLPGVTVETQSGEGAALIDCWQSHDRVYLIDASTPNGSPGQIHRIEAHKEPITTALFHTSSHAFGVLDAIELSRALDTLPEELIVYGVEGSCFDEGAELSEEIKAATEDVITQILRDVAIDSRIETDSA
jgi:hydrogenase maturation protease